MLSCTGLIAGQRVPSVTPETHVGATKASDPAVHTGGTRDRGKMALSRGPHCVNKLSDLGLEGNPESIALRSGKMQGVRRNICRHRGFSLGQLIGQKMNS